MTRFIRLLLLTVYLSAVRNTSVSLVLCLWQSLLRTEMLSFNGSHWGLMRGYVGEVLSPVLGRSQTSRSNGVF